MQNESNKVHFSVLSNIIQSIALSSVILNKVYCSVFSYIDNKMCKLSSYCQSTVWVSYLGRGICGSILM